MTNLDFLLSPYQINDEIQLKNHIVMAPMTHFMRHYYHKTLIACGGYDFQEAQTRIMSNDFNLVAIGRPFIANPDLIKRLHHQEIIRTYDSNMLTTLY